MCLFSIYFTCNVGSTLYIWNTALNFVRFSLFVFFFRPSDILKRLAQTNHTVAEDEKPAAESEPQSKMAKYGLGEDLK